MNKKELEKLRELTATTDMIKAMREDLPVKRTIYGSYYKSREKKEVWTHKYYRFYRAAVDGEILKVGIWQRQTLRAVGQRPDYTIYITKGGEWLTKGPNGWTEAKIFNLDYCYEKAQDFGMRHWNDAKSLKAAASFTGINGATVKEIVRKFQTQGARTKVYHKNELEQIDEFMEKVPDPPKGFNNGWILQTAFADLTSIMYLYDPKKKATEGFCTRCQSVVPIKNPKHLKDTRCPHCKAAAKFRSWNKQSEISGKKWVGIVQKTKGGGTHDAYCVSQYETMVKYRRENNYRPEIWRGAVERYRMTDWFAWHESFSYEEYKSTGITRWCHAKTRGMGYSYRNPNTWCVLYEGNIKDLLKDTDARYVPLDKWLKKHNTEQINVSEVLEGCNDHPDAVEKLLKAGMDNMATRLLIYGPTYMNPDGKRLQDILRLNAEDTRLARECDVDLTELKILQASEMARVRVDKDTLKCLKPMCTYRSTEDIVPMLRQKNLKKTLHYLACQAMESERNLATVYRDYEDYLHQLFRLGIPADKHARFPANFYHVHAEYSRQLLELDNEIAAADTRKKNRMLKKALARISPLYDTDSKRYKIVWPKSKSDFTREGQMQHNCVGGYFDKCVSQKTVVFFVRRAEEIDKPFATVEFKDGKLIQCRTAYNKDAPEDVMKYMHRIEEHYRQATEKMEA